MRACRVARVCGAAVVVAALMVPSLATAQAPPRELTLKELMDIDAGRVVGASARTQAVIEAPASVSFITADEIRRYGYRTLADILRGVRGMYVTDDRNFSYLGTRGFSKPGDYNSRILLLVNGHRVNDNVYGQAEIGSEFGIDPAMFERVEIIRGPASSLYGDSAFFAVVNVITRTGASLHGASIVAERGTLGQYVARASGGRVFANGAQLALSGTYERSAGVQQLFYPVFNTPATNNGVADGLDGEHIGQAYGQLIFKDLTFTGAYGRRERGVPTASFGTVFNEQQFPEQTTDRHTLADLVYARAIGATHVTIRGAFDRFSVNGTYPLLGDDDTNPVVALNSILGTRWTADASLTRALPGHEVVTAGAEFIDNVHQNQRTVLLVDPSAPLLDTHESSIQSAIYVEDEIKLRPWLIANAGLRYDRYAAFVKVTPRTALIVRPSSNQSFKYLYGQAFRAPNAYELNTVNFGPGVLNLRPESIQTHEFVWERYTHDWLRTSFSVYQYSVDDLITLTLDPSAFLGTTYVNDRHVRAKGLEAEAQMRLGSGRQAVVSYALQRADDPDTTLNLVNSPGQMAKFRLSIPGPSSRSFISMEVLSMSSRTTLAGATLNPATTAGLTAIFPLSKTFELSGQVRNLFNVQYSDPASDTNRQDVIPQNGRTASVSLRWIPGKR